MFPTRRFLSPALACGAALATLALPRAAEAAACGADFLALEEGVAWTYERDVPEDGEEPLGDGDLALEVPTEFVLEVEEIGEDDGDTVVALREEFGDIEQNTEIRCEGGDVDVSPHSFLAVGEPGGGIGIELDITTRRGESYPSSLSPGARWDEWVEAEFEHRAAEGSGAEHPSGEIHVERELRVLRRVGLEIDEESYRPYRVEFSLEGRAMVEPELDRAVEIAADASGALWFEPGVGLVRAVNRYGHDWTLNERKD